MVFTQPLEEIVRRRYSVRTYTKKEIPQDVREQIMAYAGTLSSPFGAKPSFQIVDAEQAPDGVRLGTYGMIKGASVFVASTVPDTEFAIEALGYAFEKLILYITALGLGTCWLGGTFNRGEFAKTIKVPENTLFPAVTPMGYFERKSLKETLIRGMVRADKRKDWATLFFDGGFSAPLSEHTAGDWAFPLEMLRLGPSASNKQPWRIVRAGNAFHFYEYRSPGYSDAFKFDMQSIDMGIAACHFHLACQEKGIEGAFNLKTDPMMDTPENVIYKFTWIAG